MKHQKIHNDSDFIELVVYKTDEKNNILYYKNLYKPITEKIFINKNHIYEISDFIEYEYVVSLEFSSRTESKKLFYIKLINNEKYLCPLSEFERVKKLLNI